jgi:hypothetical protein
MAKFKVGDVVEYVDGYTPMLSMIGSVGIVEEVLATKCRIGWIVYCGPSEDARINNHDTWQKANLKIIGHITETSNAPENQIPPPSPAASPALGKRTSSSAASPSRPSGRRAAARSRK